MDQLNPDEQRAVEELRTRTKSILKPNMYDDILLFYRFLKARDFNVNEAENMLRKCMTWRKLFQVDTILEDFKPREFFLKYAEPSVIGFDKDGSLVLYSASGKIEIREILRCAKMNSYMKHWAWFSEKTKALVKPPREIENENTYKFTIILDLEKLSFANAAYPAATELFLRLTNILQNNYPEYLKAIYIINAPAYYVVVFTIIKTIMSNVTLQKIQVFGSSGWKEKLLEAIDADVLPAFLGGNRTDPDGDPLCSSFVNHGGKITPEYFLSDEERYFKDKTGVSTITVPSTKKKEIVVHAKETGSVIKWEFYTKSNVGFGLFYESPDGESEEVIPVAKYETSDGVERDSYKVRSAGKYIIVFDNTYSWLSSKEVEYRIEVVDSAS